MNNQPTNVQENELITQVVQRYIDGAKSGKGEEMILTVNKRPMFKLVRIL